MVRSASAFVVASLLIAPLGAQAPAPVSPVQLRASVDQVVVDVVVTDAAGRIVSGLTQADFEVVEDGRPQTILTFTEVSLPFTIRGAASPPPAPDIRSNRHAADARVYVLFLDDAFVMASRTPGVQQVAHEFLGRHVQPGDLVAVTTSGGFPGTSQAFTEDLALAGRAIDRFVGKKVRSTTINKLEQAIFAREIDPSRARRTTNANGNTFNRDAAVLGVNAIDDEVLERGKAALRSLRSTIQSMAQVPGRRKTLIYLSEGIDVPLGPGDSAEIAQEVQGILAAAARANVAIYPLSPRGLHGMGDEMTELRTLTTTQTGPVNTNAMGDIQKEQRVANAMLRTVAEGTGGTAAVDSNQLTTALDRVATESSHYYLLGYTSAQPKRDGRFRPISVRVKRPGLHATARKGYTSPDDREPKPEPFRGLTGVLGDLLRRPLPSGGLPLAAHAVAFPGATDNVSVTIEIGAGALAFVTQADKRASAVDVAILPVDGAGRTHGLTQGHPKLTLTPEMAETVATQGLRLSHRLTLPPGTYQLRIAVAEAVRGRSGSVLCDVVVPDVSTPGLVMTPIVASSTAALATPSAYNDPGLMRALGGPPTTARAFASTDTISAYAELMDAGATASRDIDLVTVVRDARGRDVVTSPQPKANQRVGPGQSFAYAVDLPLKALAPGRYTLRLEARASGLAEPLARELVFDVKPPGP
jgi:VWFA-related protein